MTDLKTLFAGFTIHLQAAGRRPPTLALHFLFPGAPSHRMIASASEGLLHVGQRAVLGVLGP
jgi:hypothetical protein